MAALTENPRHAVMVRQLPPAALFLDVRETISEDVFDPRTAAFAFDSSRNVLLMAATLAGVHQLVGLDPVSLSTRWSVPLAGRASVVAVSSDGAMAYVGLPFLMQVTQVSLQDLRVVRTFSVENALPSVVGEAALHIAVKPDDSETIVATLGFPDIAYQQRGMAAFVEGKLLPDVLHLPFNRPAALETESSHVVFTANDRLVGFNSSTTASGLEGIELTSTGLAVTLRKGVYCCIWDKLQSTSGRLFTSRGIELDPSNLMLKKEFRSGMVPDFRLFLGGTESIVSLSPGTTSREASMAIDVEVHSAIRGEVTHRFRIDEEFSGATPDRSARPNHLTAIQTGSAHLVVIGRNSQYGSSTIFSIDLSNAPRVAVPSVDQQVVVVDQARALRIGVTSAHLAYDPVTTLLVAAVLPTVATTGNSLALVRPGDGKIDEYIALSSRIDRLAMATSGRWLYAWMPDETSIQQVDLLDRRLGWKFRLPKPLIGARGDSYGAEVVAWAVKPDEPQTLVIALDGSPGQAMMVIRNGAPDLSLYPIQPNLPLGVGSLTDIFFTAPNRLIGIQSSGGPLNEYRLTEQGLQYVGLASKESLLSSCPGSRRDFGRIFNRCGVVDAETLRDVSTFSFFGRNNPPSVLYERVVLNGPTNGIGVGGEGGSTGREILLERFTLDVLQPSVNGTNEATRQNSVRLQFYDSGKVAPSELRSQALAALPDGRVALSVSESTNGIGSLYLVSLPDAR